MTLDDGFDVGTAVDKDEFDNLTLLHSISKIGETVEGRTVLWEILAMSGLYNIATDPDYHMYSEGKRSIGVELLALINGADRKLYITMLNEHLGENDE